MTDEVAALRRFLLRYRLVLAAVAFGACLFYTALAVTHPRVATPIGVGLVALVLLGQVLVKLFTGGDDS